MGALGNGDKMGMGWAEANDPVQQPTEKGLGRVSEYGDGSGKHIADRVFRSAIVIGQAHWHQPVFPEND
jgi:hypothetical protein